MSDEAFTDQLVGAYDSSQPRTQRQKLVFYHSFSSGSTAACSGCTAHSNSLRFSSPPNYIADRQLLVGKLTRSDTSMKLHKPGLLSSHHPRGDLLVIAVTESRNPGTVHFVRPVCTFWPTMQHRRRPGTGGKPTPWGAARVRVSCRLFLSNFTKAQHCRLVAATS